MAQGQNPRFSEAEPAQGAKWLGVPNVIMVRYEGKPEPPYADYARQFRDFKRVYWSFVGASGVPSEGMIFLATNICGLNLETVQWTQEWIAKHADDECGH